MPETVYSLAAYINDNEKITAGAAADYGLDAFLYNLKSSVITDQGVESLKEIYKIILSEEKGKEKLHQAVREKKLIELLNQYGKEDYSWVIYPGNLF